LESRPPALSRARRAGVLALAAAVATLVILRGTSWHSAEPLRSVSTKPGQRVELRLPDGSMVTLGPGTTLQYAADQANREVTLNGLASFRVAHDSSHPLVVHTDRVDAVDAGTEFVVRAYPDDSIITVAVSGGSVRLSDRSRHRSPLPLGPGDIGFVHRTDGRMSVRHEDALDQRYTAWLGGQLVFDDVPLRDVARDLERWLDVDIRFNGRALAERHVTATYANPTLGVLDELARSLHCRMVRNGRSVVFTPGIP
jgi:ferric-dicitrate binding protein FerR (iron transport regulator)